MKKVCAFALMLVLAASLSACGASGEAQEIDPSELEVCSCDVDGRLGAETAENAKSVTIEVTMPEGWAPVEGSVLDVQYLKGTASFMVKSEAFSASTLDGVVQEALSLYRSSFGDVAVVGEPASLEVDGRDARALTFTCSVSGIDMEFTYVYVLVGDDVYVATFGAPAGDFGALSEDVDAILADLHFKTE